MEGRTGKEKSKIIRRSKMNKISLGKILL